MRTINTILNWFFVLLFSIVLMAACAGLGFHYGYKYGLETKVSIIGQQYILKEKGR